MKTRAFFGPEGLTATSANHLANLAKETNRQLAEHLASVKFYDTDMANFAGESVTIQKGTPKEELPRIADNLTAMSVLNGLTAYLREAIKEKDRLGAEATTWRDEQGRAEFELREKELRSRKPVRADYLTEDDVRASWSVGKVEQYLSLEAEAAVLGKYIHEDGAISKARIDLMKVSLTPKSVSKEYGEIIIWEYTPTVDVAEVDSLYFELQAKHRSVQAELNGMKNSIAVALREDRMKKDEEYALALSKWNAEKKALEAEFEEFLEDESRSRQNRLEEVESLKIVVPNRYRDVIAKLKQ